MKITVEHQQKWTSDSDFIEWFEKQKDHETSKLARIQNAYKKIILYGIERLENMEKQK